MFEFGTVDRFPDFAFFFCCPRNLCMLASENCVLCNYAAFVNVLICNGQQRFIRFRLHPKSVTSICSIVRNIYTANMRLDTEKDV